VFGPSEQSDYLNLNHGTPAHPIRIRGGFSFGRAGHPAPVTGGTGVTVLLSGT